MRVIEKRLLWAMLVLSNACVSQAQWTPTNGPYCGGDVNFLYANGKECLAGISAPYVSRPNLVPSKIFRSTDFGRSWVSVYAAGIETFFTSIISDGNDLFVGSTTGIYKSTNNGKSWFEPDMSMKKFRVNCLTSISISGKKTIFAGTAGQGIFASKNGGVSWTKIDSTFKEVDALASCSGDVYVGSNSGLFVSTNSGTSWRECGLRYYSINRLAVMSNTVIFAQTNSGLFYSTDRGNEWLVTNGVGFRNLPNMVGLKGTRLFVLSGSKLFVSEDKGKIWEPLDVGRANLNTFCVSSRSMMAGTMFDGIYRSTDNGKSWTRGDDGLMKAGIFHLAASGKYLYASTKGFGIYRSTDDGGEWSPLSLNEETFFFPRDYVAALEAHGSDVCARTWEGLYNSTDYGMNWSYSDIRERQGRGFAVSLAVSDSEIFAGTEWGLFHSTDGGKMWVWSDSGMSLSSGQSYLPTSLPGIFPRRSPGGVIVEYSAVHPPEMISTIPPRRTSKASSKLREVQALAFKGAKVFAGVTDGDVFVSADNGSYWTCVDSNLTKNFFNAFTVVGSDLFALTEGDGVFRSGDDGKTWKQINEGVTDQDAHVLVSDGKYLFLGVGNGVYLSLDNGDHWTQVNTGLKDVVTIGLTISDGYIYAGTWDYGVWKRKISEIVESLNHPKEETRN